MSIMQIKEIIIRSYSVLFQGLLYLWYCNKKKDWMTFVIPATICVFNIFQALSYVNKIETWNYALRTRTIYASADKEVWSGAIFHPPHTVDQINMLWLEIESDPHPLVLVSSDNAKGTHGWLRLIFHLMSWFPFGEMEAMIIRNWFWKWLLKEGTHCSLGSCTLGIFSARKNANKFRVWVNR